MLRTGSETDHERDEVFFGRRLAPRNMTHHQMSFSYVENQGAVPGSTTVVYLK